MSQPEKNATAAAKEKKAEPNATNRYHEPEFRVERVFETQALSW
jgi:hypothetical protein